MKLHQVLGIILLSFGSSAFAAMSDAEITQILKTSNDSEIAAAQIAKSKAVTPTVKSYAETMLKMHTEMNKQSGEIAKTAKSAPTAGNIGQELKKDADAELEKLKSEKKGPEFDKAYITSQVKMHQVTLDMMENQLIPNAKDAKLKAMLEKTRPMILDHLNQAKAIQTSLEKPMNPGTQTK